MENSKMPKVYTALWSVIVAAYTVFMIVMRKVILFLLNFTKVFDKKTAE